MEYIISSFAAFNVVDISASMEMHIVDEKIVHYEEYRLTLRATKNTNIILDSGEHLSEVDLNLTISSKFKSAQEIDRELTENDLGFLSLTQERDGIPFIHGLVPLFDRSVLENIFKNGTNGYVKIQLPTVPFEEDESKPFVWGKHRQNMLGINGLTVSSTYNQE